ncbi:hypothetical protein AVEN_263528-1 [Araneus ventricosus]|uniref:Uncharacterized protein n=1 Tax=Araneus ventricosus TaxID=182803 RepID=A0A4Y2UL21_ARAVE|nr:hypothetical protein AVEN_263528-1 [Araneus ventricosus]
MSYLFAEHWELFCGAQFEKLCTRRFHVTSRPAAGDYKGERMDDGGCVLVDWDRLAARTSLEFYPLCELKSSAGTPFRLHNTPEEDGLPQGFDFSQIAKKACLKGFGNLIVSKGKGLSQRFP